MSRYCSLLALVTVLAWGCSSTPDGNSGAEEGTGGTGGTGSGGAGTSQTSCVTGFCVAGAGSGTGGAAATSFDAGMVPLTPDLLTKIADASCAGEDAEMERIPSILTFVVDTSGSMGDYYPDPNAGGGDTKWSITNTALQAGLDNLPNYVLAGLLLWPNMMTVPNTYTDPADAQPVEACVNVSKAVSIAELGDAGSAQRTALSTTLNTATTAGGTPMHDAYLYAENNIVVPATQTYPSYPPYIVLITDGQPTISLGCEGTGEEAKPKNPQPIVDEIGNAWNNWGIKTFIIGSPGSEHQSSTNADGRGWMSQAAVTGQTAASGCATPPDPPYCHFDMTQSTDFAGALAGALETIAAAVMSCDFQIPPPPTGKTLDTGTINVVYQKAGNLNDQYLILQSDSTCPADASGQQQGWYLNDQTGLISLCPTSCNMVKQDIRAVLHVRVGCETIPLIT
jgi:hypothetical protein